MAQSAELQLVDLVDVEGLLPGASNVTLLARDARGVAWVYKPTAGERPLWDFPHGTLAHREIAFYRLATALGLEVVPETRPAHGPWGFGSAQAYLDEDFDWDPRPAIVGAEGSLWPIAFLDLVANNADRKIGHLLREPEADGVWAIDNGLTFHTEEKLRTVLWSFAGTRIPQQLVDRASPAIVEKSLAGIIAPTEVEATIRRLEALMSRPIHPSPPEDRPAMPWPLW